MMHATTPTRLGTSLLGRALLTPLVLLLMTVLPPLAAGGEAKLSPALRRAVERARAGRLGTSAVAPTAPALPGGARRPAESGRRPRLHIDAAGRALVYIHLGCPADATLLARLRSQGASIERVRRSDKRTLVQARVPLARLLALSDLPCVSRITLPSYGRPRTGSVTTEGDAIVRADLVRASPPSGFGLDGSGVKVGVISAGVLGLSNAQASGDLPTVDVLDPGCTSAEDPGCAEGTAMLEIVHDLAPGAVLGFYGPTTSLDFCSGVDTLRGTFGADVIVDDLGFFAEPYFEDGTVAQCVRDAISAGVVYVSAAGNDAETHYQGAYVDSGDGLGSHLISPGNNTFEVTGSQPIVILQWSNPFGASGDDYDLCLASETPSECASFNTQQSGADDPIEIGSFSCTNGCTLQVRLVSGNARTLELFVLDGWLASGDRTAADSIFGHPAVPGAIAVAAVNAADPGNDDVEFFSSRGDATIFFPTFEVRPKPDIAGIDGVSVTGAGGFPSPFFGTSAAAPHVAAAAALVLSANPGLDPAAVKSLLAQGAVDLPPAGADQASGAGRVDAFASVAAALCGNGTLDPGEQCDDGNTVDGDCCAADCTLEPAGSPCSDGNVCTGGDACDGAGNCVGGTCQVGTSCGTVCGLPLTCQEPGTGACKCVFQQ